MMGTFGMMGMATVAAHRNAQDKTIIKRESPAAVKMQLRFLEANGFSGM